MACPAKLQAELPCNGAKHCNSHEMELSAIKPSAHIMKPGMSPVRVMEQHQQGCQHISSLEHPQKGPSRCCHRGLKALFTGCVAGQ